MIHKLNTSFVRFLLVGIVNTVIGLSTMYICLHVFNINYWYSTFIGNSIGAAVSYVLNKTVTFKSQVAIKKSIPKFLLVILFCYFASYGISFIFSNWLLGTVFQIEAKWINNLAVLFGTGFYTILNYLGQKYLVFRNDDARQSSLIKQ